MITERLIHGIKCDSVCIPKINGGARLQIPWYQRGRTRQLAVEICYSNWGFVEVWLAKSMVWILGFGELWHTRALLVVVYGRALGTTKATCGISWRLILGIFEWLFWRHKWLTEQLLLNELQPVFQKCAPQQWFDCWLLDLLWPWICLELES